MSKVTFERKVIKIESIPIGVRKKIDLQVAKQNKIVCYRRVRMEEVRSTSREFDRIYSAFCSGEIYYAQDLLQRIEQKRGINVYDYGTVLYIIDTLLNHQCAAEYILIIKEHLQYLLDRMKLNVLSHYDYESIIVTINVLVDHKLSVHYEELIRAYLEHLLFRLKNNKYKKYDVQRIISKIVSILLCCNNSDKYIDYIKLYLEYLYLRIEKQLDERHSIGATLDLVADILSHNNISEYIDIVKKYLDYLFEQIERKSWMEYPYKRVLKIMAAILCNDESLISTTRIASNLQFVLDNMSEKDMDRLQDELRNIVKLAETKGITVDAQKIPVRKNVTENKCEGVKIKTHFLDKQYGGKENSKKVMSNDFTTLEMVVVAIGILLIAWIGWKVLEYIFAILEIIVDVIL